jgi:hypothetical protein
MKKQSKNKLIPRVPFTIEEVNALLESKGQDKSLQEKLLDYSRSSEYKFLSNLTLDRIPKPLPGVKLTRKELELFNKYCKYTSSMDYHIFQYIHAMILDYNTNLRIATIKEDFPKSDFKVTDTKDKDGNIAIRKIEYDIDLPGIG